MFRGLTTKAHSGIIWCKSRHGQARRGEDGQGMARQGEEQQLGYLISRLLLFSGNQCYV
jgi:hypothetical protein